MVDKIPSKGRGAVLKALLAKHEEEKAMSVGAPGDDVERVPPKCRGRAALLEKFKQESRAGGDFSKPGPSREVEQPSRAPVSKTQLEKVTKGVEELSVEPAQPLLYRGEAGRPLDSSANYIRLNVEEGRGIFEYEVRFDPEVDAKSNRFKLVNQCLGELATTKVYDGDFCLYLPSQVYSGKTTMPATIPNSEQEVTVIFVFKRKKKMSECLHLYNVLFKRIMHALLYSQMGKNYFNMEHKHSIPQHKLEVIPGYAVSVDEMEDGLMVCLDTQHRVLRCQTAYEMLHDMMASNRHDYKAATSRSLVGSCVMTKYNNKTYIIDDIGWEMTPKDTFPTRDGSCTFIDYYKQQYSLTIRDVDQPMLITKKTVNVGGEKVERIIVLVPELCYLTGLTDAMRSDFKIMKDVAAYTRITPNQRMAALRSYLEKVRSSEQAQKILGGWGLNVAEGTTNIKARVLPGETISFGNGRGVTMTDWNRAVGENAVTGPVDMIKWLLFYTQRDERNAQNFAQTMVRLAKGMGCVIRDPQAVCLRDDRNENYINECKRYVSSGVQVCVFICPTLRSDRYSIIKKICCVDTPIASQVVLSKTLANPTKVRSIIQKIALQITCKLGGTLWQVKFPFSSWMVCGIDVYHGQGMKSVCGFVASINESLTKYYSESMFQEREIGDFFKQAFKKALNEFSNNVGSLPSRVVIFRDGVGDGQLDHCRRYELKQFQDVIRELNVECTITFVIVQKRINTRIYSMTPSGAENPPAGTIADSIVTRRNLYDFFLVPQSVRQGTVNPTHYIVLHDDANMKPDHIQRLAYKLCHLYYNWPGTIRVPAPCQYAHKLAGLVGQYIKKNPSPELSDRLYYL